MDTATEIPPHADLAVQSFLVKLRSIARGPGNPAGIIAETLAMNLSTRTPTLRAWLQGVAAPHRLTCETLQRRLDKISSVTAAVPSLASPAGHPPEKAVALGKRTLKCKTC